jgi:hypothetical protein
MAPKLMQAGFKGGSAGQHFRSIWFQARRTTGYFIYAPLK